MATILNVPGTYPTISAAVAASAPGDTILVAAGYAGNEAVAVSVDGLIFSAPADVTGIVLTAGPGVQQITLDDASSMRIVGNAADNSFQGNAGANDLSDGGGGNDTIDGGDGADQITSSGGFDILNGGGGDDRIQIDDAVGGTVDGGTGVDTVLSVELGSYTFSNVETLETFYGYVTGSIAQFASFGGITAALGEADMQIGISLRGAGGTLDFTTRIGGLNALDLRDAGLTSAIDVTGSTNGDRLFGSTFDDALRGGAGHDTLIGGEGDDRLSGGTSDDILIGGGATAGGFNQLFGDAGSDTASYANSYGVYADLAARAAYVGGVLVDRLDSIENLTGGPAANTLVGDAGGNVLTGGDDADYLYGQGGDDVLIGGAGPPGGANQLWGGTGDDTASYVGTGGSVRADLGARAGYVDGILVDQMDSVENLAGGSGSNVLVGDSGDNRLTGGSDNDYLYGQNGDDTLIGGGAAGGGSNQLWGGMGNDTASYAWTGDSVYADLGAQAAYLDGVLVDQMNGIENLIGGSAADTLVGDGGVNRLTGGSGADSLWGRGGADVFVYLSPADSNLATGYDTIADFISGTSKLDLTAFGTDADHILIQSDAQSTSLYVVRIPGLFDPSTDLAISLVGPNAITMGDILL